MCCLNFCFSDDLYNIIREQYDGMSEEKLKCVAYCLINVCLVTHFLNINDNGHLRALISFELLFFFRKENTEIKAPA